VITTRRAQFGSELALTYLSNPSNYMILQYAIYGIGKP